MVKATNTLTTLRPTPTPSRPTIPPTTGQSLINTVRDLIRAFHRADNDVGEPSQKARLDAAWRGTFDVARATAFIPVESGLEALAQIIFLQDELENVLGTLLLEDDSHQPPHVQSAIQALRARPVLLAKWIEQEFGIKRESYGLEFFGSDDHGRARHLPHLV